MRDKCWWRQTFFQCVSQHFVCVQRMSVTIPDLTNSRIKYRQISMCRENFQHTGVSLIVVHTRLSPKISVATDCRYPKFGVSCRYATWGTQHSSRGLDVVVPELESHVSSFERTMNSVSGCAIQDVDVLNQTLILVPKCKDQLKISNNSNANLPLQTRLRDVLGFILRCSPNDVCTTRRGLSGENRRTTGRPKVN